jgi:hypothetical protein
MDQPSGDGFSGVVIRRAKGKKASLAAGTAYAYTMTKSR